MVWVKPKRFLGLQQSPAVVSKKLKIDGRILPRFPVSRVGLFPNLIDTQFLIKIAQGGAVVCRRHVELLSFTDAFAPVKSLPGILRCKIALAQVPISRCEGAVR